MRPFDITTEDVHCFVASLAYLKKHEEEITKVVTDPRWGRYPIFIEHGIRTVFLKPEEVRETIEALEKAINAWAEEKWEATRERSVCSPIEDPRPAKPVPGPSGPAPKRGLLDRMFSSRTEQ